MHRRLSFNRKFQTADEIDTRRVSSEVPESSGLLALGFAAPLRKDGPKRNVIADTEK